MFISHSAICLNYINAYFLNADGKQESIVCLYSASGFATVLTLLFIALRFAPYFCSFLRSL